MKLLDCNWIEFVRRLETWSRMRPETRGALRSMKNGETQPRAVFGADFETLLAAKFLTGASRGERARPHTESHSFLRALRAFQRVPVLRDPQEETLRAYIGEHFTEKQRTALLADPSRTWYEAGPRLRKRITSREHLLGFLEAADARKWERERLATADFQGEVPDRPVLDGQAAVDAARRILQEAMAARAPIPFAELPQRLAGTKPRDWENGLHACLRLALLFGDVDAAGSPVFWIWPPLARRLQRNTALETVAVEARSRRLGIVRLEDLTALLVALCEEPARLKSNDHEVFARDSERLSEAFSDPLEPLEFVESIATETRPMRLDRALNLALQRKWLARARVDGRSVLQVTDAGRGWLGAGELERLRGLLDSARITEVLDEKRRRDLHGSVGSVACLALLVPDDFYSHKSTNHSPIRTAFVRTWAELDREGFFPVAQWLDRALGDRNPLFQEEGADAAFEFSPWRLHHCSDDELERMWRRTLASSIVDWMWPFGGIELAAAQDGRSCMRLTPLGRYLIGACEKLEHDARPVAAGRVVVQPTFEVVFLAPSSVAEAAIARFCARRGRGVGTLFEITRETCLAAAAAGMTADQALAELARISAKPIPQNVAHELRAWFGSTARVQLASVELIRCPDETTARRVLSAAAGKARALSNTVLEIVDPSQRAALVRALRKQGVFVDAPQTDAAERPRRR